MALIALLEASVLLSLVSGVSLSEPRVQIGRTTVVGTTVSATRKEVNQFMSIPYAEPPVGKNRFRKPVPVREYPMVLDASGGAPPACVQHSEYPFPWYENTTRMGEDCLYLNVWAPAGPGAPRAVLFWVHGGAFVYGSGGSDLYNATVLAAMGDIVVVTINYRLNVFGFLTLAAKNMVKNAGLWDILEALKWVNSNIGGFGGDPSRITIAGESAGSMAVGLLSVSPLARGLFARQVMQSGSPVILTQSSNTLVHAQSEELVLQQGCTSKSKEEAVECLRGKDAHELSKDYDSLLVIKSTYPVYGDKLIPGDVKSSLHKGSFKCDQLLIGNNADEGTVVYSFVAPQLLGFFGENVPDFEAIGGRVDGFLPGVWNATGAFLKNALNSALRGAATPAGDATLVCPDVYYAELCAKRGGRAYFYWFAHRPSNSPWAEWMGVTHFSEIQFAFGRPFLHPGEYTEEEVELSRSMVRIWSSFVQSGNPGIEDWPQYSKSNHIFRNITVKPDPLYGKGPEELTCALLRPIVG